MLPRRDGLSVIAGLRARGNETPVLILSALGEVDDRVTGPARRRRRLPDQALRLLRTARPRRGARGAGAALATVETTYRAGDLVLDRLSHTG
jgi:two-component system OmpR family response regulator